MLACPAGVDRPFERADAQSDRTGDALLMTEFGATDDVRVTHTRRRGRGPHAMSWQYWTWWARDVCCERPNEGIIIDPAQPPTPDNVKQPKLDVLVRPVPARGGRHALCVHVPLREENKLFELTPTTPTPRSRRRPKSSRRATLSGRLSGCP
jgi:endoglycosylceramidase